MTSADTAGPSRPKATLFCQTCGHESPITGDWDVHSTASRITTRCPTCGATVDERPADDHQVDPSPRQTLETLLERSLESLSASVAFSTLLLDPRP